MSINPDVMCIRVIGPTGRTTYLGEEQEVNSKYDAKKFTDITIANATLESYRIRLKKIGEVVLLQIAPVDDDLEEDWIEP